MLDRCVVAGEPAEDGDVDDGRALDGVLQRVLSRRAGREVAAEERLVDVVDAGLEVMAHAAEARRPGEVVLVLALDLDGGLRGVDALAGADAARIEQGRVVRHGQDGVLEVRVLEDEVVDLVP